MQAGSQAFKICFKLLQSPAFTPVLRDKTLKICTRVKGASAEPLTNDFFLFSLQIFGGGGGEFFGIFGS